MFDRALPRIALRHPRTDFLGDERRLPVRCYFTLANNFAIPNASDSGIFNHKNGNYILD